MPLMVSSTKIPGDDSAPCLSVPAGEVTWWVVVAETRKMRWNYWKPTIFRGEIVSFRKCMEGNCGVIWIYFGFYVADLFEKVIGRYWKWITCMQVLWWMNARILQSGMQLAEDSWALGHTVSRVYYFDMIRWYAVLLSLRLLYRLVVKESSDYFVQWQWYNTA